MTENTSVYFWLIVTLIVIVPPVSTSAIDLTWSSTTWVTGTNARYLNLSCSSWGESFLTYIDQDTQILHCFQDNAGVSTTTDVTTLTDLEWPFSAMGFEGDTPDLIYYDFASNRIHRTAFEAGSWQTPSPLPLSADTRSIVYCVNQERPHIATVYEDPDNGNCQLRYISKLGDEWFMEVIDTIATGVLNGRVDMAIDSTGTPHFVWWDYSDYQLYHAVRNGANDYTIEQLYPGIVGCLWINIEITANDIPVVGFLDTLGSSGRTIRYNYRSDSTWKHEDVATFEEHYTMDMAVNPASVAEARDLFFIVSLPDQYVCYQYDGMVWQEHIIDPLSGVSPANELFATWDRYHNQINFALSIWPDDRCYLLRGLPDYPTPTPTIPPTVTPTFTPSPSPTPTDCSELGATIRMPSQHFTPGSPCSCHIGICNPATTTYPETPVFALLDIYGSYFFAPAFSDFDHYTVNVDTGYQEIEVLPTFIWPDNAGTASDIWFYAAMTDPAITSLLGTSDAFMFGWSE